MAQDQPNPPTRSAPPSPSSPAGWPPPEVLAGQAWDLVFNDDFDSATAIWMRNWAPWSYEVDVMEGFDRDARLLRNTYWWGSGSHFGTT